MLNHCILCGHQAQEFFLTLPPDAHSEPFGDSYAVQVTGMSEEVGLQTAVGEIPYL